jgi:hypothetical protein
MNPMVQFFKHIICNLSIKLLIVKVFFSEKATTVSFIDYKT